MEISLAGHFQTQHGISLGAQLEPPPSLPEETQTYHVLLLLAMVPLACLVEGCQRRLEIRMGIRVHFMHYHVQENVVIVEEGNLSVRAAPDVKCWYHGWT